MEIMNREITTVTPANWVPGPPQGDWTYEEYAALTGDGECYEVVQGVLVMSPAPEVPHQKVVGAIYHYLCEKIEDRGLGEVLQAPLDVVLSEREVYQPDVLVILNEHASHIQRKGIVGAPDLVVEVVSPSSVLYDRVNKHMAYEQARIPEYWLVHENEQTIEVFVLENWKYRSPGIFQRTQVLPSRIIPQMVTPIARFFAGIHNSGKKETRE